MSKPLTPDELEAIISDAALARNVEDFASCKLRFEPNAVEAREMSREILRLRSWARRWKAAAQRHRANARQVASSIESLALLAKTQGAAYLAKILGPAFEAIQRGTATNYVVVNFISHLEETWSLTIQREGGKTLLEVAAERLNRITTLEAEIATLRAVPKSEPGEEVCVDDDCPFPEHLGECPPASPTQWEHIARLRARHIGVLHRRVEERSEGLRQAMAVVKGRPTAEEERAAILEIIKFDLFDGLDELIAKIEARAAR